MADDQNEIEVDGALEKFRRGVAERVRADDADTHFDLGVAYAEMGLFVDAAAEFELVLRHDPNNSRARAELAVVHAQMGNPPKHGPTGTA